MHTLRAESPSRKSEGDSVRRVVNARKSRKPDECGTSFQSSPKINRMFITRLICNTMKVYITRPVSLTIEVLLIKIVLFFDHWRNHLFQSYQRFQAIEFVDRPVPEKLEIFRLFLCMHGFRHASILSTVFTVFAKNAWDHNFPFWHGHRKKKKRNGCILRVSLLKQARVTRRQLDGRHLLFGEYLQLNKSLSPKLADKQAIEDELGIILNK